MNKIFKIVLILIISLILYFIIPWFLAKTGVYQFQQQNFVSYTHNEHHHDEDEGSIAYFESEFEQQPYRLPYDSSLKMLKLSLLFIIISFIIRELYLKKYG